MASSPTSNTRPATAARAGEAFTDPGSDEDGPLPVDRYDLAAQFARITSSRWPTIRFVGVWDTVASVIVPRTDRGLLMFTLEQLAFTNANPSVKIFRQACAIDERRRMFRLKTVGRPAAILVNRFVPDDKKEPQDILQVWFSGVHCDVGGGYAEAEAGLSKYPLIWMIDEAAKAGLQFNTRTVNQLAWGIQRKNSPFSYVAPSVTAPIGKMHDSMNCGWRILEFIPKRVKYREWPGARRCSASTSPTASRARSRTARMCMKERVEADARGDGLQAGEFAGELRDRADAASGRRRRDAGGHRVRYRPLLRHCERSEAIQSPSAEAVWIASSAALLAMTKEKRLLTRCPAVPFAVIAEVVNRFTRISRWRN